MEENRVTRKKTRPSDGVSYPCRKMHSVGLSQNGSHTCMRASSMEGAARGACEVICRVTQGCRVQLDPITVLTVPTPEEVLGGEDDALDGEGSSSSDVTDGFLSCLANQNRESNSSDSSVSKSAVRNKGNILSQNEMLFPAPVNLIQVR